MKYPFLLSGNCPYRNSQLLSGTPKISLSTCSTLNVIASMQVVYLTAVHSDAKHLSSPMQVTTFLESKLNNYIGPIRKKKKRFRSKNNFLNMKVIVFHELWKHKIWMEWNKFKVYVFSSVGGVPTLPVKWVSGSPYLFYQKISSGRILPSSFLPWHALKYV